MAHFLRLMAGVLALWVGTASAVIPVGPSGYGFSRAGENAGQPWGTGTTLQAACSAAVAALSAWRKASTPTPVAYWTPWQQGVSANQTFCYVNYDGYGQFTFTRTVTPGQCPANSSPVAGGCQCASGFQQNAGSTACIAPPTSADKWKKWCNDAAGQNLGPMTSQGRMSGFSCMGDINIVGSPIETPGYNSGDIPPNGGCTFLMTDRVSFQDPNGDWHTQGTGKVDGGTCMTGETPVPPDSPEDTDNEPEGKKDPCPNGAQGTVNGTAVCAKHDPTAGIDWAGSSKETKADGSTVETAKETSCVGGKCTTNTKTTTKDASGNVINVSNTSNVESIGETCKKDPGGKGCTGTGLSEGGGGEFGGTCAQGFTAKSEDPVVNAMALEQHKRNCILFETETDERTAYEADKVKGRAGTDQTGELPGNKSVNVSELDLQGTSLINVAACITDKTFVIVGRSVTLPFSRICEILGYMGTILVACAYLTAARIVTKG